MDSMVATTTRELRGVDNLNLSGVPNPNGFGTPESHQFSSLE